MRVNSFGISQSTRDLVAESWRKLAPLPLHALPALDESLRNSWTYLDDWYYLRPEEVAGLQPLSADDWIFVRLLASHRNGYVRAEATNLLGSDPSRDSLPFLLLRLVDWVDQVRSLAELHVCERLRPEYADGFINCLPLLQRLGESTRLRSACTEQVFRFLREPLCAEAVGRGMRSESYLIRRECFRFAAQNPAIPPEDVIEQASTDPDVLIRKWAFFWAANNVTKGWPRLRERAAADPYTPIRRIAFESYKAESNTQAAQLVRFLFDRSPLIRNECQSSIDSHVPGSAVEYYRNGIGAASTRNAVVCILGLTETGDCTDAAAIARWLSSSSARTRIAVIRGLRVLKADHDLDLLALVAAEVPSVAREAGFSLLIRDALPTYALWGQCLKNPEPRVWLGILKLLRKAGKWVQLRLYTDAVGMSDPGISAYAVEHLQRWVSNYNRSFAQPTKEDRQILAETLDSVRPKLPPQLMRALEFILQSW